MLIELKHSDITSELCQRCAACCRIEFNIANTDSRYRTFLRQVGLAVDPPPKEGQTDCCADRHNITVDLGYCKHLEILEEEGDRRFRCGVYGTSDYPELCAQFDCVSWALANNDYSDKNKRLVQAQTATNMVRLASGPGSQTV